MMLFSNFEIEARLPPLHHLTNHQVQGILQLSDHYPIKLRLIETIFHRNYPIQYKTQKADWTTFRDKTKLPLSHFDGNEANIDEQVQRCAQLL